MQSSLRLVLLLCLCSLGSAVAQQPAMDRKERTMTRLAAEKLLQSEVPEMAEAKLAMQTAAEAYELGVKQHPDVKAEQEAFAAAQAKMIELAGGEDAEAKQAAADAVNAASSALYTKSGKVKDLVALQKKSAEAAAKYREMFTAELEKRNPALLAELRAAKDRSVTRAPK